MATQYLGKVAGIITTEALSTLTGVTGGTIVQSGDITWLKFKKDNKILLVADRVIKTTGITWNVLNTANCAYGKDITIQDSIYACRLFNGTPNNEYTEFIVNLVPSIGDSNWGTSTITNVPGSTGNIMIYGKTSVDYGVGLGENTSSSTAGWRPVLEYAIMPPSISTPNEELGNKTESFTKSYTVTDANNRTLSLTEKLDGNIIRTLTNQASGTSYILDLVSQWDSLSYGNHTIEIIVDNEREYEKSTVTITFNKIKEHTLPIETATLDELITHFENIGKDWDYEQFRLSENLKTKGVEVLETDKMSNLIDKVGDITIASLGGKKWASGTTTSTSGRRLIMRGLNFKPSVVLAYLASNPTQYFSLLFFEIYPTNTVYVWPSSNVGYNNQSATQYEDGFDIYTKDYSSNYKWIAYE